VIIQQSIDVVLDENNDGSVSLIFFKDLKLNRYADDEEDTISFNNGMT